MVNIKLFQYLSNFDNILYHVYNSPAGKVCFFGNNTSLKASIFYHDAEKKFIQNIFKEGINEEIDKGIQFLENYFNSKSGKGAPESPLWRNFYVKDSKPCKIINLEFQGKAYPDSSTIKFDLGMFTLKEVLVYVELTKVLFGDTISYKSLAARAGVPSGARFVGNTMAKNVFPVLIPCHRVIKSDGSIGRYSGGKGIKNFLLEHESNG